MRLLQCFLTLVGYRVVFCACCGVGAWGGRESLLSPVQIFLKSTFVRTELGLLLVVDCHHAVSGQFQVFYGTCNALLVKNTKQEKHIFFSQLTTCSCGRRAGLMDCLVKQNRRLHSCQSKQTHP